MFVFDLIPSARDRNIRSKYKPEARTLLHVRRINHARRTFQLRHQGEDQIRGKMIMRARGPGHGEHFAVKELALAFRLALDFEVFRLGQPMNWIGDSH